MDHVDLGGDHAHGLGPMRARVLALLQDAGEPLTAAEVGRRLDLHANSARFHLDALTEGGHVSREAETRTARGRPRMLYAATSGSPAAGRRRYALLAGMLATVLHDQLPDPAVAAERSGRGWARSLVTPSPSGAGASEAVALAGLVAELDEVGFDSRVVDDEGPLRMEVSHCPFLEVADGHRDVVCSLHLGLMRGLLEEMDAPLAVADLEPLVEPSLCVAHLVR